MSERWTPDSWRAKPVLQMPDYPDAKALADVEAQLATFPPLVFAGEARNLKKALARVAAGEAFLLQGGDCAESFAEHGANNIRDFFRVLPADGGRADLCRRAAGGEGRPHRRTVRQAALLADGKNRRRRAAELSRRHRQRHRLHAGSAHARSAAPADGLPAVGGDAEPAARLRHRRLCQSRQRASVDAGFREGLAAVAALQGTGGPDLATRSTSCAPAGSISKAIPKLRATDFYTSHEALLLGYEQALTRVDSTTGDWYATSGHMIWIGDRTRQLDHGHVEYFRGIKNPIGLKCGPSLKPDELLRLIDVLNPDNEPGRLTLINRFGSDKVGDHLPQLIRAVKREGRVVVWSCDPMHGNTITSTSRLQDPAVRPHPVGGEVVLHHPCGRGHPCRRRASGDDRPGRHRMHRRRARRSPMKTSTTAITRSAIRVSMPSSRSTWLS